MISITLSLAFLALLVFAIACEIADEIADLQLTLDFPQHASRSPAGCWLTLSGLGAALFAVFGLAFHVMGA